MNFLLLTIFLASIASQSSYSKTQSNSIPVCTDSDDKCIQVPKENLESVIDCMYDTFNEDTRTNDYGDNEIESLKYCANQ